MDQSKSQSRIEPGPGQESVWDYPRPPRVEPTPRRIRVEHAARAVADTTRAMRVLETSHPPTYYLPPEDVDTSLLRPAVGTTLCEWKGAASYYDLVTLERVLPRAAWTYNNPYRGFEAIAGYFCFYPTGPDACYVDDERIEPQEGDFYGGWITSDLVGPFKGGPGSRCW